MPPSPPRRHRRAVGPPGARPSAAEPRVGDASADPDDRRDPPDDDARLSADRPPHHDRDGSG